MGQDENRAQEITKISTDVKNLGDKVSAFTKELTIIKLDLGDLINVNIDLERRFIAIEKQLNALPGFVLINDFEAAQAELRDLVTLAHNMGQKALAAKDELERHVTTNTAALQQTSAGVTGQLNTVMHEVEQTRLLTTTLQVEVERYRRRINILNVLVTGLIALFVIFAIIMLSNRH